MPDVNNLSEREQEILKLVAQGASNKEIAHELSISSNTVKVHLRNIFSKIGANSRTEAAMFAVGQGLVTPNGNFPEQYQNLNSLSTEEVDSSSERTLFGLRRWNLWVILGTGALVILIAISLLWFSRITEQRVLASASQTAPFGEPQWTELRPLPVAREGLAVGVYENQIYAISGSNSSGVTGEVEQYDPTTDQWNRIKDKPTPVRNANAAVIGGKIYIPGGETPSGAMTDVLEVYDPLSDTWTSRAPIPEAVSGYGIQAYEGKLYIFGGWDGEKATASVYAYSPELNEWTLCTPLPTVRAFGGAGLARGKIYIFGGYDGKEVLSVNEVYTPSQEGTAISPWATAQPLPQPRAWMGSVSLSDIIHVVGGKGDAEETLPALEYPGQSGNWKMVEPPREEIWLNPGMATMGTQLYLIGGELDGSESNLNLTYQVIYLISLPVVP